MKLGIEVLERKFVEQYGGMTEREYWWFADQALDELLARELGRDIVRGLSGRG